MDAGVSSKVPAAPTAFEVELRGIVGPEHLRAATSQDSVAGVQPQTIVEPANAQELAKVLKFANDAGLAVVPRGGASKLDWGNPPNRADILLSTKRLDKILEHAWSDMTVTVEAGCSVATLQESLAKHGQRLAIDPLWPQHSTIGGILSTNDSGVLRLRFGALRDLIIGITLALSDGTLASSGGKVVKNVAGYDLPKLATGAFGTLGVITRAVFRLHPMPHHAQSLTVAPRNLQEAERIIHLVQNSKLAHTALQARLSRDAALVDILFEGTQTGVAAQQDHFAKLIAPLHAKDAPSSVWNARQELLSSNAPPGASPRYAVAKLSFLPAAIASSVDAVAHAAHPQNLPWRAVLQANGIACVQLDGSPQSQGIVLTELRNHFEREGGSLVLLERSPELHAFDAWGDAGDALPLMRAVKRQLDPKSTLNPGRFVGGI